MKVAALDLGTNTFILLIAEVSDGEIKSVIHDEARIVRLGQGVGETKRFHPEALARAEEALAAFGKTITRHRVDRVRGGATSAARDVANGTELIAIGRRHGIPIEIITGECEAELTFAGTISGRAGEADQLISIIDVGGGSTEIISGRISGLEARQSLNIGSVRLTERFVHHHPVPPGERQALKAFIDEQLKSLTVNRPAPKKDQKTGRGDPPATVIAVAGTPTTLATLDQGLPFESDRVEGYALPLTRLRFWVDRLAGLTVEERQELAGMEPKRADVIVAGAMILLQTAEALGTERLEVSIRGLRYGIALAVGADTEADRLGARTAGNRS